MGKRRDAGLHRSCPSAPDLAADDTHIAFPNLAHTSCDTLSPASDRSLVQLESSWHAHGLLAPTGLHGIVNSLHAQAQ